MFLGNGDERTDGMGNNRDEYRSRVITAQKPAFGTSLEEHLKMTNTSISLVLEVCIACLMEHINEEGLFRISGSSSKIKRLKYVFDTGFQLEDLEEFNEPHAVAGTLKCYLRELPEPLLTYALYHEWIGASKIEPQQRLQALWQVVQKLPKANLANLKYLIRFLLHLSKSSEFNRMSPQNIAIAVAPSLMWPPNSKDENAPIDLSQDMTAAASHNCIISLLLTYADYFFPENGMYV